MTCRSTEHQRRRRAEAISLLGGKCVDCGTDERLEFDHIDPSTKLFSIGAACQEQSRLLAELAKCQLLCRDCHQAKTSAAGRSEEARAKTSATLRGRSFSAETRAKMSAALVGNTRAKGRRQSAEHVAKRLAGRAS